ncbi:hypothetical protein [Nocardioides pacificus]
MMPQRRPAAFLLFSAAIAALVAAPATAVVPAVDGPAPAAIAMAAADHVVLGSVTGPGGTPWENVKVAATPVGSTVPAASALTYGGRYELRLAPGTYRVAFSDLAERVPDQERASLVTVLAGQIDALDLGAQRLVLGTVTSSLAPAIVGAPHVGSTLSVTEGSWTPGLAVVEPTWVAGETTLGAGSSLRLAPAQLGKRIHVATAATRAGWLDGAARTTPVTVGKAPSTVSASAPGVVRRGKAARVNVVVSDRSGTPVKGTVTLTEKGRKLGAANVAGATKATRAFVLKGLRPGVHVVVVTWSGSTYALPGRDTLRITVKR